MYITVYIGERGTGYGVALMYNLCKRYQKQPKPE